MPTPCVCGRPAEVKTDPAAVFRHWVLSSARVATARVEIALIQPSGTFPIHARRIVGLRLSNAAGRDHTLKGRRGTTGVSAAGHYNQHENCLFCMRFWSQPKRP